MTTPTADDAVSLSDARSIAHRLRMPLGGIRNEGARMIEAQADEIDRLRGELSESRRLLDEARITLVGIAGATARAWELPRSEFIDEFLPWAQSRARFTVEKIAAPVPAQPDLLAEAVELRYVYDTLEATLCDQDGDVVIEGSAGDRRELKTAITTLRAFLAKYEASKTAGKGGA